MLRLDPKWNETAASLLRRSVEAPDRRLRERFAALALVAMGQPAQAAAAQVGHHRDTVCGWVKRFNARGPDDMDLETPNPAHPELTAEEFEQLRDAVSRPPRASGIPTGRWTGRHVAAYIQRQFGKRVHPATARRYLHRLGFRLKRPRKRLNKADPDEQLAFAAQLPTLEQERCGHSVSVWVDEGHIWQDALLRWVWCLRGQEAEVDSTSPGKKKLSFYVAVVRPLGWVITLLASPFNQQSTARFLTKVRARLAGWRLDVFWDGASCHKGAGVAAAIQATRAHVHPLPAYSPEMNAAEAWIRWAKEALSYNTCWQELSDLTRSFNGFVLSMAHRVDEILQRCVPETLGFGCV